MPFFFEVGQYLDPTTGTVIRGEIHRYTAGDPTAGNMAGGYLFKMWGLPAAAIAIWHSARPENRAKVGGIMISAALTSFLTGITEPIEFSFLFVAPLLYALHALLAGVAYFTCIELGIKHGMTFSHGLIDFVVLFNRSTHGLWFLVLGPLWALMYYGLFRYVIRRFDLKTPGREVETDADAARRRACRRRGGLAGELVAAFGGRANIQSLDACITRLRVQLVDPARASPDRLKALGATGVVKVSNNLQAIFGTRSENLKSDMEAYLRADGRRPGGGRRSGAAAAAPAPRPSSVPDPDVAAGRRVHCRAALGGARNIVSAEACALTRVRVQVRDRRSSMRTALRRAGVAGRDAPRRRRAAPDCRTEGGRRGLGHHVTVARFPAPSRLVSVSLRSASHPHAAIRASK